DRILQKTGPLTPEERRVMEEHPLLGFEMLRDVTFLSGEGLSVVRNHHERFDGAGYPDRLQGTEIPLAARSFAVAATREAVPAAAEVGVRDEERVEAAPERPARRCERVAGRGPEHEVALELVDDAGRVVHPLAVDLPCITLVRVAAAARRRQQTSRRDKAGQPSAHSPCKRTPLRRLTDGSQGTSAGWRPSCSSSTRVTARWSCRSAWPISTSSGRAPGSCSTPTTTPRRSICGERAARSA